MPIACLKDRYAGMAPGEARTSPGYYGEAVPLKGYEKFVPMDIIKEADGYRELAGAILLLGVEDLKFQRKPSGGGWVSRDWRSDAEDFWFGGRPWVSRWRERLCEFAGVNEGLVRGKLEAA